MISRFARACLLGLGSTGSVFSVGEEPSPSQAIGAPDCGAQPLPNAQQFVTARAATRNRMHFEIIVTV